MEKKKALAAVMATMLIASSLTACGGTKDTENMDASQTSSAQTQDNHSKNCKNGR